MATITGKLPPMSTQNNNKNPTKTHSHVCCTLENMRDELLTETKHDNTRENTKCPEIKIKVQGVEINTLIDSGSEITCISQTTYDTHIQQWQAVPLLPVKNTYVRVATERKQIRIEKQLYMEITINEITTRIIILVVPKLTREMIIGVDTLIKLNCILDLGKGEISLKMDNKETKMKFETTWGKSEEIKNVRK